MCNVHFSLVATLVSQIAVRKQCDVYIKTIHVAVIVVGIVDETKLVAIGLCELHLGKLVHILRLLWKCELCENK